MAGGGGGGNSLQKKLPVNYQTIKQQRNNRKCKVSVY